MKTKSRIFTSSLWCFVRTYLTVTSRVYGFLISMPRMTFCVLHLVVLTVTTEPLRRIDVMRK